MRSDVDYVNIEPQVMLRKKKLDSAGRDREQIEAMEKNAYRDPKLSDAVKDHHDIVADEQREYPKAMYRLALKDGKPAGDELAPNYPLPWDLAVQLGQDKMGFTRLNHTATSVGNVILRKPYVSCTVGEARQDETVDLEGARKKEAALRAEGWTPDLNSLTKYFPGTSAGNQGFDPLPDELMPKTKGR